MLSMVKSFLFNVVSLYARTNTLWSRPLIHTLTQGVYNFECQEFHVLKLLSYKQQQKIPYKFIFYIVTLKKWVAGAQHEKPLAC